MGEGGADWESSDRVRSTREAPAPPSIIVGEGEKPASSPAPSPRRFAATSAAPKGEDGAASASAGAVRPILMRRRAMSAGDEQTAAVRAGAGCRLASSAAPKGEAAASTIGAATGTVMLSPDRLVVGTKASYNSGDDEGMTLMSTVSSSPSKRASPSSSSGSGNSWCWDRTLRDRRRSPIGEDSPSRGRASAGRMCGGRRMRGRGDSATGAGGGGAVDTVGGAAVGWRSRFEAGDPTRTGESQIFDSPSNPPRPSSGSRRR